MLNVFNQLKILRRQQTADRIKNLVLSSNHDVVYNSFSRAHCPYPCVIIVNVHAGMSIGVSNTHSINQR